MNAREELKQLTVRCHIACPPWFRYWNGELMVQDALLFVGAVVVEVRVNGVQA